MTWLVRSLQLTRCATQCSYLRDFTWVEQTVLAIASLVQDSKIMVRTDVRESIAELTYANDNCVPIERLTRRFSLSVAEAYEVQVGVREARLKEGKKVLGYKIGLTSAAMRRQLKVAEPDFGCLLDDMFYSEFESIATDRFISPRVEPEVAFVLAKPLVGPGLTVADAARAVAFTLPALEIIDSRIRDWDIGLADTIADNGSAGGVVLGGTPVSWGSCDMRLLGTVLNRNGAIVATGASGAVMGNPLVALTWLANALGTRGASLAEGEIVLSGSCTVAVPVKAGDTVSARIAGHGTVTAHFGTAEVPE